MSTWIPDTLVPRWVARERLALKLEGLVPALPVVALICVSTVGSIAWPAQLGPMTPWYHLMIWLGAGTSLVWFRLWYRANEGRRARLEPWQPAIRDPRWQAALGVLRDLRGDDRDSPRAERIFEVTLALAESFVALEAAGKTDQTAKDRTAAALDPVLAQLGYALVASNAGDGRVSEALEDAFRDLRAIVSAEAEIAGRALPRPRPAPREIQGP